MAPHLWFVAGLTRDEVTGGDDEPAFLTEVVGPPYAEVFTLPVRRYLYRVLKSLEVDLIFVEDGVGYRKNEPVIRLHMEAYLGAPESFDSVDIEGSPNISSKITGGIHGDVATASIVVNSIPKVLQAPPGLHTMRDLALPSFFSGR